MASLDDIEQLEQEASPAVENAAQASLPSDADVPDSTIKDSVLADAVHAPSSPGEDTNSAESAAQASLPSQSNDAQLSDTSDRLSDLLSGKVQATSDEDNKMLQDYLSGVKNDAPGVDGQQFLDAKPVSDDSEDSNSSSKTPINPQMAQAIDNSIQNPIVKQYLKDKYGFGPELDDAALKASQEQAARNRNLAMIGRGFDQIGAGFARHDPDSKFWDQRDKDAQIPVENLLARRSGIIQNNSLAQGQINTEEQMNTTKQQMALNDPTSPESIAAQKAYLPILQKAGLDTSLLQNASANTIKSVLDKPLEFINKQKQSEAEEASTAELKKEQIEASRATKQKAQDDKASQQNSLMQDKIAKQINALSQSSRSSLGMAGRTLVSADRALDILNSPTVSPQDLNSVSADISNIISGAATVSGTKHQEYNTLATNLASGIQKLTSNPQDVDAPELKNHLKDVVKKMRDISSQTIQQNLNFVKTAHPDFVKNNPTYFEDVATGLAGQLGSSGDNNQPTQSSTPAAANSPSSPTPVPAGKIHVSNGKNSFYIDPSDLADAQKDGYNQVQ